MSEDHSSVSMVVIDDNSLSLEFVATALARPGLEIFTTTKPEDGLVLIAIHHPQVVLSDVVMPGINGLDILQRAKQLDPAIDVVLMSAHETSGNGRKAVQQATDYLRKPISLSLLRERVGRLIDKHLAKAAT